MAKTYRYDTFKYVDILQKETSYFLALAETLNISKAAEDLGIQQSGLSKSLRRLETDLGQKIFHRKNNGLALTQAGEIFLNAVRLTKTTWEKALQGIIENSDTPTGLLKIGFHSSFGQKYFPLIAKNLDLNYPQVEIETHNLSSAQVTRKVNSGEIDIGLVISQIRFPEIVQKKIGTDYIAGFQRDLSKTPSKILINPDMQISNSILRKYGHLKKIISKDYEVLARTVIETNSIGFLPKSVVENYPRLNQVGGALLKADISCISHKEKMSSLAHKKIFDAVVKACLEKHSL